MSPLSPCFIIVVIITDCDVDRIWDTDDGRLGWAVDMLFVLITEGEKELQCTQYLSLGCWLIYNCCLISQKERAEPAASGQPSSYLHYCPLSLPLSLSVTLISSLIFVSFTNSFFPLLHCLSFCICLSISCFNSLTSRAIIPLLLFLLQRKKEKKKKKPEGVDREPFI